MKSVRPVFFISMFFVIIVMLFPLLIAGRPPDTTTTDDSESPTPSAGLWMSDKTAKVDYKETFDESTNIKLIISDGSVVTMSMKDYLIGVVAAEMPALFEMEALKAQAVAARTYSLYRMTEDKVHEGGALCTNPGCCNAYISMDGLREKWGKDFDKNIAYITQAVTETDGICVSYEGKPIFAAFFSSSVGQTENSENVWSRKLPYLRSVTSPETADEVPNYVCDVTISFKELREVTEKAYPEAKLGNDPTKWLTGAIFTENERLAKVSLGGIELRGTDLRSLFKLRSACLTWKVEDDGIRFETTGYGHGVGMSQYGANAMAKAGSDYIEILNHYYTGIDIAVMNAPPVTKDSV